MDVEDDGPGTNALYAFSQTSLYIPPPVVRGRIPKNAYGNLDVYVPTMVPPGGSHVRHKHASKAARLIGVDYADAVTGFQFKGRHGTAVTDGIVVAEEYREAVLAVLDGFEYEQETHQAEIRSAQCLRLWRRFLTGLRIGERLGLHKGGPGASVKPEVLKTEMNKAEDEQDNAVEAGGFFPDPDQTTAVPTAGRYRPPGRNDNPQEPIHAEQPEDEETHEEDIQEEAPRMRRQRKITIESDVDDSEDDYVPEKRQTATRRGKCRLLSPEDSPVPTSTSPSRALPSRRSRTVQAPAQHDFEEAGGFLPDEQQDNPMKSGGGFIPDADTEQADEFGGGFIPETNDDHMDDFGGGFIPESNADQTDDFGGGFLPEDGGEDENTGPDRAEAEPEAELENTIEEDEANFSGGGFIPEETAHSGPNSDKERGPLLNEANLMAGVDEAGRTPEPEETVDEPVSDDMNDEAADESESEKGSLLSHDPDDEDAEPEWLNSD